MKKITGLVLGLMMALPAAYAQDDDELKPFFIGIDYVFGNVTVFDEQDRTVGVCGDVDRSCDRVKFRPDAARINIGMNLHPKFAIMAAYGRGNGSESGTSGSDGDAQLELSSFYGVYARASTALQGLLGLRVGGILGYSGARIQVTPDPATGLTEQTDESVSGVSYGFELSYPIFGSALIVADWTSLVDEDQLRIAGTNVGFRFGFGGGEEDE